jgi:rhodanese-related sulfurtransferase
VLVGALAIVVGSAALGVVVNHFSPHGIPLLVQRSEAAPALDLPTGIVSVSLAEFQAAFRTQSALLVDARPPEEYEEGHVPGAVSLPAGAFEERYLDLMDVVEEAEATIVYCGGFECSESIQVAERLLEVGRTQVGVFEQGWRAWSESGGPSREGPEP